MKIFFSLKNKNKILFFKSYSRRKQYKNTQIKKDFHITSDGHHDQK